MDGLLSVGVGKSLPQDNATNQICSSQECWDAKSDERNRKSRGKRRLVEILADMEEEDDGPHACFICRL